MKKKRYCMKICVTEYGFDRMAYDLVIGASPTIEKLAPHCCLCETSGTKGVGVNMKLML